MSTRRKGSAGSEGVGLWLEAAGAAVGRQLRAELFGSWPHRFLLSRPRVKGFIVFPRDFRPTRAEAGQAILAGLYDFAGRAMTVGPGGDPWDRTSPSRAFATELHGFGWLRHLIAADEAGAREALRLVMGWARVFGGWNAFSWSGEILERRVFNLACAMAPLTALTSDAETELLAGLLARQARHLLQVAEPRHRAAERAVAAATAAAMLPARAGDRLLARSLKRINRVLPQAVLPDGGHVTRSPEAALDLLLDLLSLDDGWAQRGLEAPLEAARAIDRLTAALRFFTLPDGRLARFQGGEDGASADIAAARAHDDAEAAPPVAQAPHTGYQRLSGRSIQVMLDAGPPAVGVWSLSACAQAGAVEVLCGGERLVTNSGWSARVPDGQAMRLTDGGSTVALGHASAGRLLGGWCGKVLGPRLVGGPRKAEARRAVSDAGVWLDFTHDGWVRAFGLVHERRLFLDLVADELRGEDRFVPVGPTTSTRLAPYTVHFHLPPEIEAVVARDNKSVLLRGPSQRGWWLRNDAVDVRVEPAVHFREGRQIMSQQVVLMGHVRVDKGGRVRWKLARVPDPKPGPGRAAADDMAPEAKPAMF